MEKKDKTISVFMTAFIGVLLAVALIGTLADTSNTATSKLTASDESYNLTGIGCYQGGQVNGTADANCNITVTYAPTGWEQEDCPLTSVVVTNSTGTALTLDTDYYLFPSTGIVQMLNTTDTDVGSMGDDVLIDYSYCGDGYLNSSWGRTILDTNVGMFAIAILIIAIAAAYVLLGKKGDDD